MSDTVRNAETETIEVVEEAHEWEGESVVAWTKATSEKQDRLEIYLEWLLTPKPYREPSTKVELAERLGISTRTLRNYDTDPWLRRELIKRQRSAIAITEVGEVLESLLTQAKDPENGRSVQAARVIFDWLARSEDLQQVESMAEISDDDLQAMLAGLLEDRESK